MYFRAPKSGNVISSCFSGASSLLTGEWTTSHQLVTGLSRAVVRLGSLLFWGHYSSRILMRTIYAVIESGISFSWQEFCRHLTASQLATVFHAAKQASVRSLLPSCCTGFPPKCLGITRCFVYFLTQPWGFSLFALLLLLSKVSESMVFVTYCAVFQDSTVIYPLLISIASYLEMKVSLMVKTVPLLREMSLEVEVALDYDGDH